MRQDHARPHRVAVLAIQPVVMFDLTVPLLVFARPEYDVKVATERAGAVQTTNGLRLLVDDGLELLRWADTVVVPGFSRSTEPSVAEIQALRSARATGARLVSICTGAFALAAAGLLDGWDVTTHWAHAADLADSYPRASVNADVLYLDHGSLATSAGVTAGIDLCLHLLESDLGSSASLDAARSIVAPLRREGGQAQFRPAPPVSGSTEIHRTMEWATAHLDQEFTVSELALRSHVSVRTFQRRCMELTGLPAGEWLIWQRLALARRLLEDPAVAVGEVARRSGFQSPNTLRHHFRRLLGTTPTHYRSAFVSTPQRGAAAQGHESPLFRTI